MENTRKGPGRPPSNAHLNTCSGEPISEEELEKKRSLAEEKKCRKQKKNCQITNQDSNSSNSSNLNQSSYSIERILNQSSRKRTNS